MTRRLAAAVSAAAAAAWLVGTAAPASAHGFGGRVDLPVPRWLFVYGAAAALVISFVALSILWRDPKLQGGGRRRPLPDWIQAPLRSRPVELIVRGAAFILFVIVFVGALVGNPNVINIAPVFVFAWFWVGLAIAQALLGNLWATLSPWDTLARMLGLRAEGRPYPNGLGRWPAVAGLFAFAWMELVDPSGAAPRAIGIAIAVYSLVTITGMAVFGREIWNRNGEAFAVYFDLFARISPLDRDGDGRVVLRPVLGGLPLLEPRPGVTAMILVALGSTTFDGFSRIPLWTSRTTNISTGAHLAVFTAGLLAVILLVAGAYALAMVAANTVATHTGWHVLAVKFAHSLVPIAFAYVVAHYFSLLVLDGQQLLATFSDPFGIGWNLFGTAHWEPNLGLVSPSVIWFVQVAAIVGGHVAAVVLGHDRAIAIFPAKVAVRTQYALLAVMVLFTVIGLLILSGG